MQQPKLIFLNGPAGIGKSTIAKKYIDTHPLAMYLNGDEIIAMLGQWLFHEDEARELVFVHAQSLVTNHLQAGYTVIVPYLLQRVAEVERFEAIAKELEVPFYELLVTCDREQAVRRLLQRGTWGEPNSPPITDADKPIIHRLYDTMEKAVAMRSNTITIQSVEGAIEDTHRKFLHAIEEAER